MTNHADGFLPDWENNSELTIFLQQFGNREVVTIKKVNWREYKRIKDTLEICVPVESLRGIVLERLIREGVTSVTFRILDRRVTPEANDILLCLVEPLEQGSNPDWIAQELGRKPELTSFYEQIIRHSE